MLIRRSAAVSAALSAVADLVVLPGNHLLIVGIGTFDQPGEDLGRAGAEAEVILAPGDLDRLVGAEEPADLFQRLGRDDQVGLGCTLGSAGRHIHAGQPVPVGGHHAHPLGAELPQHPIQDRAALFGARRKCHMRRSASAALSRRSASRPRISRWGTPGIPPRESEQPKLDRPHSIVTRCSPEAVRRIAALGSSRTISTSFGPAA